MTQAPTGRPPGARWAVLEAGAHVTTSRPAHHGRTNHDTPGGDTMNETTPTAAQVAATAWAMLEEHRAPRATVHPNERVSVRDAMTSDRAAECAALEAIAEWADVGCNLDDQRDGGADHEHADNVSDAEDWATRYPSDFRAAVQEFVAEFGADTLDLENNPDPVGRLEDCARYWVQYRAWHRMADDICEAITGQQVY